MTLSDSIEVSQQASRSCLAVRLLMVVLACVGAGISAYLTYVHYQNTEPICLAGLDCNSVLFSPYAQVFGFPLSLLGLAMYVLLAVFGVRLLRGEKKNLSAISLAMYATALSGTLFSIYLIYLELFKIHAFCSWCLGSAVAITGILLLSIINLSAGGFSLAEVLRLSAKPTGQAET